MNVGPFATVPDSAVSGELFGVSVLVCRSPRRTVATGRDSEPNAKRARLLDRVPGVRERAPRRNALVVLAYLLSFVLLVGLFGRLLGLVP